jgi:transcriptional regulator with XRE-family HTH domain
MWLREARRNKGLSQKEIAKQAGISQQGYSFIESGTRTPSVPTAKRIASALGFDWQRFYEEAEEK